MTISMPTEIPLPMPPGDAIALADLARDVAGAASCLTAVDERLVGAAATAPGWLGDDAAAAATQIGTVTALVWAVSEALVPAIARLDTHAERLLETRRQVADLKEEQARQFAEAWGRWGRVDDLHRQVMTGGAEVRAIVAEVEAGEASRRRRHTAVLEELEDDATATARVLAESCAVVGGRGAPGDGSRVVAYLAAQLPGWGDLELARRGRALAASLTAGTVDERSEDAADVEFFAGRIAFANALLAGLGEEGVAYLLNDLGTGAFGLESAVARLLASAFGAARASGESDPVDDVLTAVYVRADDRYGASGAVAAGLATVLAAGSATPSGGVQTRTVAEWSRQLLLWEHKQRMPAGMNPANSGSAGMDPTELAVGILADRSDEAAAAALLRDDRIWEAMLSRVWGDGGLAVSEIVAQAGAEPGATGDRAIRTGLSVLGSGLAADDPADWTVNRDTVAVVAPVLGIAVAAHVSVAVEALQVGVDGGQAEGRTDVLKGLGYLTLDRGAAEAIGRGLHGWALVQPTGLDGTGPAQPLPVIAVPSAYLAVQEFGQRHAHTLDGREARETAENREFLWDVTVGFFVSVIQGPVGVGAGVAEGYLKIWGGYDGTWDNGVDRGLDFDGNDAVVAAVAQLSPERAGDIDAVRRQAEAAFDRTARALGETRPPTSPEVDYLEPLEDAVTDVFGDLQKTRHGRPGGLFPRPR